MAATEPQTEQFIKPAHFELRLSLLLGAVFIPVGIHLPYFPLWLEGLGFSATQIALVLSVPMFLRLLTTPFITAFADKVSDRAHVLIAVVAAAGILSLLYLVNPDYVWIFAISVLIQIVWTPQAPLAESLVLSGVRRFGTDYASIRKWGSAAFLAANLAGGWLVSVIGASSVPLMITTGLAIALIAAINAPRLGRPRRASPLSATTLRAEAPALFSRGFLLVAGGAGIINASHGLMFSFGTIYWKSIGLDGGTIGMLWAWAVVAEIILMMAFRRVFGGFSAPFVLIMAGVLAIVRWALFPLIEPAGLGTAGFFASQTLHAFSTGLVLIGVPKMVIEAIGEERLGSAQGVVFFGNGLSMAAVTLVSGPIYASLGVDGFYLMAAVALLGLALVLAATVIPTGSGPAETPASRNR